MLRVSMLINFSKWRGSLAGFALLAVLLAACSRGTGQPTQPFGTAGPGGGEQATSASVAPSPSPEPTATSAPLALRVNGLEVSLAAYQSELAQYQEAAGREITPEDQQVVLDSLIDQALLAQAAAEQGFVLDEAALQARIQALVQRLGDQEKLNAWKARYGYNDETFRQALALFAAAAWMRDQVIAQLPTAVEQIHARQILFYNQEDADAAYQRLQAGNDFGNLAAEIEPLTRGDLGWSPRGYLFDPKLEEALFNLQPGAYTPVIQTLAGFHIVQLIERSPDRPLEPEALWVLQTEALRKWLQEQRSTGDIQVLLP